MGDMITNILLCFPREDRPCVLCTILILLFLLALFVAATSK